MPSVSNLVRPVEAQQIATGRIKRNKAFIVVLLYMR